MYGARGVGGGWRGVEGRGGERWGAHPLDGKGFKDQIANF